MMKNNRLKKKEKKPCYFYTAKCNSSLYIASKEKNKDGELYDSDISSEIQTGQCISVSNYKIY